MKRSDRELGMDCAITRRGLFIGVKVAVTGSALAGPWAASKSAQAAQAAQVAQVAQVESPAASSATLPARSTTFSHHCPTTKKLSPTLDDLREHQCHPDE